MDGPDTVHIRVYLLFYLAGPSGGASRLLSLPKLVRKLVWPIANRTVQHSGLVTVADSLEYRKDDFDSQERIPTDGLNAAQYFSWIFVHAHIYATNARQYLQ